MLTPVVLALGMLLSALAAAPITQSDRDKLIQDLERSRKIFLDALADVTTEAPIRCSSCSVATPSDIRRNCWR